MTDSTDGYWDELGVAWCAIDPDVTVIASRLEARLRRQSRWMTTGLVIGLSLGVAGLLLGVATIGVGLSSGAWNFVTRGIALIVICATLMPALSSLRSVSSRVATMALSHMIELTIGRAQRIRRVINAGLYACLIAAVFGLVGTGIRTYFGRPPRMSPIMDLTVLALVALALVLFGRLVKLELEKYRALKRTLELAPP